MTHLPRLQASPLDYLFVSDLDGTLIGTTGISATTLKVLSELLSRGLSFTIATARSSTSRTGLEGLPLTLPLILHGGARIVDPAGRVLSEHYLDQSAARALVALAQSRGLTPWVFTYGYKPSVYHFEPQNPCEVAYLESRKGDPRLRRVTDLVPCFAEPITQVSVTGLEQPMKDLADEIGSAFDVAIQMTEEVTARPYYWLELQNPSATKEKALRSVAAQLGIPMERVVVFGDSLNDAGMFRAAGMSVAVANAHPALKAIATLVLERSCEDDAVADYLTYLTSNSFETSHRRRST